ncbi:MAG: hypothetical protein QOE65_580 [Solirubrobacteraceae bacterium]|jgi:hypothetical protein|nr:hypothetical protein [Solirubrobacteraceae bacterium]
MATLADSRLRRLARHETPVAVPPPAVEPEEVCELCGARVPPGHRHVLDLEKRDLLCACKPCSLLFDRDASGGGHYRLVPDRRLALRDFALDDPTWERLSIPVDMAFFFRSAREERVMAYYPSPAGPTESLLGLEAWEEIAAANPVLGDMADDVEALLVDRARGARRHWLVPIEDCYALVGLIRTRWRGFNGGAEVWEAIDGFFEQLDARAAPSGRE